MSLEPGAEMTVRSAATDHMADPDDPGLDLGLRSCHAADAPPGSALLFGQGARRWRARR